MARSSHNGALVFGLVLGAAGGVAWALWNAREPGAELQARLRGYIDDALGRTSIEAPRPTIMVSGAAESVPKPLEPVSVQLEETPSVESVPIVQQGA